MSAIITTGNSNPLDACIDIIFILSDGAAAAAEELGNELNLFYVACTRAMCNLYIMCEEQKPFDPTAVKFEISSSISESVLF